MKFLLDVNALLAGVWGHHARHAEAFTWLQHKSIVLYPLTELGFLRISSNKRAINIPIRKARQSLEKFCSERKAERIFDTFRRWTRTQKPRRKLPTFIWLTLLRNTG